MAEHGLVRLLAGAIQRARKAEKIATLLLLFILLSSATASVTTVLTGPDWTLLWESLLVGLLIGWWLAILRWPIWRSVLFMLGLGVLFCLLFAGGMSQRTGAIFEELFRLSAGLPTWLKARQIDLAPLSSVAQGWLTALEVVSVRVVSWVRDLAAGRATFDPVAAGIVWSFVVWLVSAWAGWAVEALHSALMAVLPALSLNLSTFSYSRNTPTSTYLLLGITLVLIAVVQYGQRQQEWDETRVAYPQRKGRQVGNVSLLIAILLVLAAAFLSSLSLQRITQWTAQFNRSTSQSQSGLAKSLGIQQPTAVPNIFSDVRSPGLPRSLLIGASPVLLSEVVMSVEVDYLSGLTLGNRPPPLYWRSYTYDIYTGHGWSASPTNLTHYQPNQPIQSSNLPYHLPIQEVINPVPNQAGTLYAAGEPLSADVSTTSAWRSSNDLFGIQMDATSYTVQSLLPTPSEDTLRLAGQDYPAWVAQRYLALPEAVPDRVKQLAIRLTATEATPYDRARAIEQYLRTTFPYTIDVPYPPANQDLVDYFLFDLRKGYCDYYASAMVVLARAAGIPARLAVGYASGTYNLNSGRFIVTQAEAHSWVEIYFPGVGWVPFEPTAARTAIDRSAQPTPPAVPTPIPTTVTSSPPPSSPWIKIGSQAVLGFIALVLCLWIVLDEVLLNRMSPGRAAVEIYRRLRHYGRLLKTPGESSQTPDEFASSLIGTIISIDLHESDLTAPLPLQIQSLIRHIVRLSYRPSEPGETVKAGLVHQWRSLRWQLRWLWVRWLWKNIRQLFQGLRAGLPGKVST
jgi:transglutaminase-like putative cysteine protease/uncharacterized membrane protein YidH (DUF202 family)